MGMASARRRAETFAAVVDGRAAVTTLPAETRAFVALVDQLRDVDGPVMRPEFSADLRARLLEAAPAELATSPTPHGAGGHGTVGRSRRLVSVAAASCVVLGTGVGIAAASQSALPGDALYPVKRGIERVEVAITSSRAERGDELMDQATTRLEEVRDLVVTEPDDPGTAARAEEAIDDFEEQARDASDSAISAYRDEGSEQSIVHLRDFADESASALEDLRDQVPREVQDDLVDAGDVLTELDRQARNVCPTCSTLAPLQLSAPFLELSGSVDDVTGALVHPARTGSTPLPGTTGSTSRTHDPAGGADSPTGPLPTLASDLPADITKDGPDPAEPGNPTVTLTSPKANDQGLDLGRDGPRVSLPPSDDPLGDVPDVLDSTKDTVHDTTGPLNHTTGTLKDTADDTTGTLNDTTGDLGGTLDDTTDGLL